MIHLILVSHHPDIARGIAALAAQMSAAPETIHTAAGIDDADNPVGTDAVRIMQTLLEADNPDGILILVDLGSAILSAQTALDLLDDPALVARCRISAAPLVEGAISAAVAASSGADLETVAREATQALAAKQVALGENVPASTAPVAVPSGASATITLTNRDGLHARPAARLAAALAPYHARLVLTCGDKQADGKSLNQLALLQARHGDRLTLHADGDDAAAALQTFRELAAANFGDPPDERDGKLVARATPATAATIRAAVWRCDPPQHDARTLHADRAADIHDLAQQVLALLADAPEAAMPDNAPFILVARDLYPLRAATLPANCLAVVLADGDLHSHAALLCQAAQRPYYSGAGDAVLALTDGEHIQITRASGEIRRLP